MANWKESVRNEKWRKQYSQIESGKNINLNKKVLILESKLNALLTKMSSGESFERIGSDIRRGEQEIEQQELPIIDNIPPEPDEIDIKPASFDRKFAIARSIDVTKDIVEHSLNMGALKSRNVTRQAKLKQDTEALSLGIGLGQAALINPAVLAFQVLNVGIGLYQEQQKETFERDQKNRESEIRKSTLGTILTGGGR